MRHAILAQKGILRLQPDREIEGGGILQCTHQHLRVDHRYAGLAKGNAAGLVQFGHLRQSLAGQAEGEGADGIDMGKTSMPGAVLEHLDQARFVEGRIGVRRAGQCW
jgi:hypothetical protein